MKITDYTFGRIVIDGHSYDSDILIYPDGQIDDSWWRNEGHRLTVEDIEDLLATAPRMVIAGTGASGRMKPDREVRETLTERGIEFQALPTEEATALFNEKSGRLRVAACLHLTC